MSRLFIYDENMVDERAKITVAKMAAVSDIVAPEKQYIQYTNKGEVTVLDGCVIAVGENAVFKTVEKALTKANLSRGQILNMERITIFIFATLEQTARMKFI